MSCFLSNLMESVKMKRRVVQEEAKSRVHANPMPLMKDFPSLAEWLTAACYEEDGAPRAAPSITIFCMAGEWRAALKDKDLGQVMWLSAQTADDLVILAEQMVLADGAPWRHDEGPRDGKRVNGKPPVDRGRARG